MSGWLIAGRALRPISRITETAKRISGRNLSERISLDGPRDASALADTFDTMLCRLDSAFEAQKRFVANASHELRTPLAIVRTEIDVTLGDPSADRVDLREMAGVVRDANERMELLIDSLLALATSGAGAIERRPTDLAMITEGALERLRGAPAGLTVDAVLHPAPVTGDAVLLSGSRRTSSRTLRATTSRAAGCGSARA